MIMKEFSHDEIFLIIVLILLESFHSWFESRFLCVFSFLEKSNFR
jgi:hypothetical protein